MHEYMENESYLSIFKATWLKEAIVSYFCLECFFFFGILEKNDSKEKR